MSDAAGAAGAPRARAPNHAVSVGDCLSIGPKHRVGAPDSSGGVGFVVERHDDCRFDLRYSISNRLETKVSPRRILSHNPLVLSARRIAASTATRPSLLSTLHRPVPRPVAAAVARASVATGPSGVASIILRSKRWHRSNPAPNPLLKYLRDGRTKPKGWLRKNEAKMRGIRLIDGKGELTRFV